MQHLPLPRILTASGAAPAAASSLHQLRRSAFPRRLQPSQNGTSSLNSILANLSLALPDASVDIDGGVFGAVNVRVSNVACDDLSARNVSIDYREANGTTRTMALDVSGLSASCQFDWAADAGLASPSGSGAGYLDPDSYVRVAYDFLSEDYAEHPPASVVVSECASSLAIEDLELDGDGLGIISTIADAFNDRITDAIEGELSRMVCDDVLATEVLNRLNEVISSVNGRLEPYLDEEASAQDPLEMENAMDVPTNEEGEELYVNFQTLRWFDKIQEYVIKNIQALIDRAFLNNNGVLEVDPALLDNVAAADSESVGLDGTNVTIAALTISGLDTLHDVELLDPIGKYTLRNGFEWEELTFLFAMDATHDPSQIADVLVQKPDTPPVTDSFTMVMTVKGVEIDMSVLLGINIETLGELALGSILDLDNLLPCVRSAVEEAAVTQLSVQVSEVTPPEIEGFLDQQMTTVVNEATAAFFSLYQSVILRALPSFFGTVVKDMINDKIDEAEKSTCPRPDASLEGIVDYRDLLLSESQAVEMGGRGGSPYGDLFRTVYGALVDIMAASDENGMSEMNQPVGTLTKNQSGVEGELYWDGYLFKQSMTVDLNGLNAAISVAVSDLRIYNIDTMAAPIELLGPVPGESSNLNNSVSIGVGPDPLRASLKLLVFGEGDKTTIDNEVELGLSLSSLYMILQFLAQMEEPTFLNFPLKDIFNLNCWMATIVTPELDNKGLRIGEVTMGVEDMAMFVEEAQFDFKCISCSSPMLLEMEDYFSSEEGVADATTTVNAILDTLSRFIEGEYVQNRIDKMLYEAPYQCPHSPEYNQNFAGIEYEDLDPPEQDEGAIGFLIAIIVVVLCVIVISFLVAAIARIITRRRHNRWLKQLNESQIMVLAKEEQYETERQQDLNRRMKSLVFSPEVPLLFKIGIPIAIFGNIALFLSGHLSLGGTVNISGSFAGQEFNIEGFFEFSMVQSTIDMWKAGAKELAIMIAIVSGLWPYTKQLISLVMWLVKPTLVSSKRRGSILHWLDLLGKWSMVDVFVLIITLASFRITIESPDHVSYLPEGLYEINMLVVPLWGLYANMLAQIVSQISSHIIIHYHKKTIAAATRAQEEEWGIVTPAPSSEPVKLRDHSFRLDYEASSKRAGINKWVNWALLAALLALAVLVILGCALPSFSIEVLGLLGLAVESGNEFEQAKTHYSVFSLAQTVMDEARYLDETTSYLGLGTLASLLVLTVFVVPLFQTASLLIEWFIPISSKQRHLNGIVNEILSAWQYMEVFVISVIITSWQLAGVSDFMVNAYCGELAPVFSTLAYFGIVDANDAQCFQLKAVVETASWLLVAASLVLAASSHFVITASKQKLLDEYVPTERRRFTDRWSKEPVEGAAEAQSPDEAEGVGKAKATKSKVSPIPPRFTDYYRFATWTEHIASKEREVDAPNQIAEEAPGLATPEHILDEVSELATPPEHVAGADVEHVGSSDKVEPMTATEQIDESEVPQKVEASVTSF